MRPISHSLQDHDLLILRVIGEWWEIDLTGADKQECIQVLSEALPDIDLEQELTMLPPEEADALHALVRGGGRLPVSQFSRQFGEIREMGPAALAREEPWFSPESPAEDLWYRGLIYKGFNEGPDGMVEYIYLPDEFMARLAGPADGPAAPAPKRASDSSRTTERDFDPVPPPERVPADTTTAVDDVTTILALAQVNQVAAGPDTLPFLLEPEPARAGLLVALAEEIKLLRLIEGRFRPTRPAVAWLQMHRELALRQLVDAWPASDWNELRHTPGLICEGSGWYNDPMTARRALIDALINSEEWFRISDVIGYIKRTNPDFQRPNGNYQTWYIRDSEANRYLTGFEAWDQVEGRLLQFILTGPMSWLGLVLVAGEKFRLTRRGIHWLEDSPPVEQPAEKVDPLVVHADGLLTIGRHGNRYHRFQAGRIADLQPYVQGQPFVYRVTSHTLTGARDQGIQPQRALEFLQQASGQALPGSTRRAIERWSEFGTEARLETMVILRVAKAEILETLRQHPKTRPFLGEILGDLAATVAHDHWPELLSAAAQLGLLLEPPR